MATKKVPTLDGSGKIFEKHVPNRLGEASLNATIDTRIAATSSLDGGNASSTYTESFNFDGGSAA
jgi:hypothetical protein